MAENSKWDADLYDEKHSFVWKMAAALIELLAAKRGERILDVGCGTGHLSDQIAATGAEVTAIDLSADMIARARAAHPAIHFEVADARKLNYVNEFEAVFSNATLHWINDPEAVAVSISRALRRGGRFVAEFGGRGNIAGLISAFRRAWENLRLPDAPSHPWYYPGIPEYSQLLERHHLEVTYAALFDRPTPLEDGKSGLRNWLAMFAGPLLTDVPGDLREKLVSEIESEARYDLFHVDHWIVDYRRLRIVAHRL